MTITVSTDGSALGNPNGPMGWAWADHEPHAGGKPGHVHEGDCDAGGATNGTNQIGELCAVLEALRAHPGSEPLIIETDSQYAINCSTKWVHGWKKNGWKNSQKKPVKNAALIKAIDAELAHRAGSVKFVWVKGHAGNAGNEKVDELARTYAGDCRSGVEDGYLPLEGWQSLQASEYAHGLTVPADAQSLLDGAISNEEYHLGRGKQSESSSAPAHHDDHGTSVEAAASPAANSRKPSLVDLLTEPEGVPELNADGPARESADTADAADITDTADAATAESPAVSKSPAPEAPAPEVPEPEPSLEPAPTAPANTANAAQPLKPTVLRASGTLRFTPPPASSPTFDGRPRLVHGMIEVEGYVNGDGTITINDAQFYMR
ncbi:ribonuclease H [Bifidobacterium goeldii]|uniref:ribonuclease H n=1 Tax=Bifidobacterium goeldii TaxID=2306975 RepID=A0A430FJ14_9BIFI|nr:ribonuclease H [Bifidobacterium goeldii]RSX52826.1 ribonuclease H [Bifidobacterium goeldii]